MQLVPTVPWDDLVTKDYFDTQLDARLNARLANMVTTDYLEARLNARFANMVTTDHLDARLAKMDAKLERSLRSQMVWLIATIITFNGALAAFVTLAH